jgi:hypothetical protein
MKILESNTTWKEQTSFCARISVSREEFEFLLSNLDISLLCTVPAKKWEIIQLSVHQIGDVEISS